MTDIPEPPPIPNDSECLWDLLISMMHDRDDFGRIKYDTCIQAGNGRGKKDILDELLDASVYILKDMVEEEQLIERVRNEEQERIAKLVEGVSPNFLRSLEDGKLIPALVAMVRTPRADWLEEATI